jgi:hypothetical protein
VCRRRGKTFSLLPIQLIPYFQYTVSAVIGALLLGYGSWQGGRQGFFGASVAVDPDSDVSPYLLVCWLKVMLRGLRRAHAVLRERYDLSAVRSVHGAMPWKEAGTYFLAFGWKPGAPWVTLLYGLLRRYSRDTAQFLFGTASQHRVSICH